MKALLIIEIVLVVIGASLYLLIPDVFTIGHMLAWTIGVISPYFIIFCLSEDKSLILFWILVLFASYITYDYFQKTYTTKFFLGKLVDTTNYDLNKYLLYEINNTGRKQFVSTSIAFKNKHPLPDSLRYVLINKDGDIIKYNLAECDTIKYAYPIEIMNKRHEECGNNTFVYAMSCPDIFYNNYGYNLVFLGRKIDDNHISVILDDGFETTIEMKTHYSNPFLLFRNINPDYYDGWHICDQSVQNATVINNILSNYYGYYFQGKVYSKDVVEPYLDIPTNYKNRMQNIQILK